MPPFDSSHGARGVPTPTRPGRLLRFVAVNAEGGRQQGKGLRTLLRKLKVGPLIAAIDELDGPVFNPQRIVKALTMWVWGKLHRVRVYQGTGSHGAQEVGHAVLGGVIVDHHESRILTDGGGWSAGGAGQARFVDIVLASVKRSTTKVASLSTHAPTGTKKADGSWAENDQAARWRDGLATLAEIVSEVRGKGYAPVLSGDMNEQDTPHPDGLRAWATANGLVPYVSGVMWVLVDKSLTVSGHRAIDLAGLNVSDHKTALEVDVALSEVAPKPKPKPKPVDRHYIPGAIQEPIPQTASDPFIIPVGAIFHVAVSESTDLHDFFSHDGGIEAHGYILRDGTIKQYRPLNVECDAQFDGNSWVAADGKRYGFTSWESQGMGNGEWTPQQVSAIKEIIAFHHAHWGVPLEVAPAWNAPGFGYHALFYRWNKTAHSCPGPDRVAQFKRVIVPWLKGGAK